MLLNYSGVYTLCYLAALEYKPDDTYLIQSIYLMLPNCSGVYT